MGENEAAKKAFAIREICKKRLEWPFLRLSFTADLKV
jgi:hypothetical protein